MNLIALLLVLSGANPVAKDPTMRQGGIAYSLYQGEFDEAERSYRELGKSLKYPIFEHDDQDVLSYICRHLDNSSLYGNVLTGIRWCKERGADVNAMGGRPLWIAARKDYYDKGILRLLEYGANPNLQPWWQNSIRLENGKYETKRGNLSTILMSAIEGKRTKNVAILLKHKADPNKFSITLTDYTNSGTVQYTPLAGAAKYGQHETIALLAKFGAKVNAKNPTTGYTALHVAVLSQQEKCVETLLKFRANRNLKDAKGKTSLALARSLPNKNILQLLLR